MTIAPSTHDAALAVVAAMEQVVIGRRETVEMTVAAVISGGHVLIEDLPGSGKTTMARALAHALGGQFRRIQGTADLMPADITGSAIWEASRGVFTFVPGPLFANVVLVDELNRMPPRTQSALLEAMDEGAVTVDGVRHALPEPFVLLATQNPFEQWGTFPLPQGQLDRFTVLVRAGSNPEDVERQVVREQLAGPTVDTLQAAITPERAVELRREARRVHVHDAVLAYTVALAAGTRHHPDAETGASTRATIALIRCAQGRAVLAGRSHVTPDDIKALAVPVLAHRLAATSTSGGSDAAARIVADALRSTPTPLSGA